MRRDSDDAAGDVLNDTANQYIYDGEGRVCAMHNLVSGETYGYLYDGNGDRIAKGTLSSFSSQVPHP